MAVSLKGITTVQRGIELDETGINVDSFNVTYEPEFKQHLNGYDGHVVTTAIGNTKSTISVSGEWKSGASGLVATAFATAQSFANDVDGYGQSAGGAYADRVEIGQSRDGFRMFSATYTRHAAVA